MTLRHAPMFEHFVAIDNVTAWPNLKLLPSGTMVAIIFNQPCHAKWEGDVECWGSADGGASWRRLGAPAPHEPGTARMNVAAGLAANGDLTVLAGGWSDMPTREAFAKGETSARNKQTLIPWVCRSSDGGHTWTHAQPEFPDVLGESIVPFGDIVNLPDGTLSSAVYSCRPVRAWLIRSRDQGRTWPDAVPISAADGHNETALLRLDSTQWLAAARSAHNSLDLYVSGDGGATWTLREPLTGPKMNPGHLLRLRSGVIVLTYGVRFDGFSGVFTLLSEDLGKTWRGPVRLADFGTGVPNDTGYPSSVERADGLIVTAWYARQTPGHARYHMGITRWRCEDVLDMYRR